MSQSKLRLEKGAQNGDNAVKVEEKGRKKMTRDSKQNFVVDMPQEIEGLIKRYPAVAEAARYGVDISLLLSNLRLSVSERIRRHQAALNAITSIRNAKNL